MPILWRIIGKSWMKWMKLQDITGIFFGILPKQPSKMAGREIPKNEMEVSWKNIPTSFSSGHV
jgi:hypothetical protein